MLAWLAPVLVFGLVVFVHELGHFIAAKLTGVYAPRFAIGFGRAIWKWRRGETEYLIGMIPLGGYVRMASKEDEAQAFLEGGNEAGVDTSREDYDPDAMIPFGPKPIPENRWFESKSLAARLFIMLAGVTMNTILTLVILIGLFKYQGVPVMDAKGLAQVVPVIEQVLPGRPAAKAGIQVGDSIVAINGQPVKDWEFMHGLISNSAGQPLVLKVIRNGQPRQFTMTPMQDTITNPDTKKLEQVGRIGIAPRALLRNATFAEAVAGGWDMTWHMGGLVFTSLKEIASKPRMASELGGPILIAQQSVEAAHGGLETLLTLIALISINVAVFNLLPIPILDGGQIVINILETIKGSAFSPKTREYILRTGLAFIGLIFALVMFNDLKRLVVGFFTGS